MCDFENKVHGYFTCRFMNKKCVDSQAADMITPIDFQLLTLGEEIRDDLNRLPFVESDIGKKILNCKHCENCKPMKPEYQKYNFLEDDSVAFCAERKCCVHLDDVCAMLTIDVCEYCDIPTYNFLNFI